MSYSIKCPNNLCMCVTILTVQVSKACASGCSDEVTESVST